MIISMGMMQRMKDDEFGKIKIRQPLPYVEIDSSANLDEAYNDMIKEELNVKEIKLIRGNIKSPLDNGYHIIITANFSVTARLNKVITPELRAEGLMREIIRHIQAARKKADLNVDDRIELNFISENTEVLDSFKKFEQEISKEVLATKAEISENELDFVQIVKVEGSEAKISLKKA